MLNNLKVSFFLAYKSIKRGNLGTTILTIIIMSLIFVNLIFMPSILSGIGESIEQQVIDCFYGHLVIEPKEGEDYIDNADSIQKKLNNFQGVVGVSSHYITGATFSHKNKFVSSALYSINPADEILVTKYQNGIIEGEYLSDADIGEIIMGSELTGTEGEENDQADLGGVTVGDKVKVTFSNGIIKEYRIKGIFEISRMGVDKMAFITEKEMESVLGMNNKASHIIVRLSQRGREEEFKKKFMEIGISEDIKTWKDKSAGMTESILDSFDFINVISMVVSLAMGVVMIFIIIYINTVSRRKQIGILKAIGIDQRVIIRSYIMQALFYCFCGIIAGSFILWFLTSYLIANPLKFPMGYVRPVLEQQLVIQSITSLIIVSLIGGFIPSWKTAREDILKAIWG